MLSQYQVDTCKQTSFVRDTLCKYPCIRHVGNVSLQQNRYQCILWMPCITKKSFDDYTMTPAEIDWTNFEFRAWIALTFSYGISVIWLPKSQMRQMMDYNRDKLYSVYQHNHVWDALNDSILDNVITTQYPCSNLDILQIDHTNSQSTK